MIDGTYRVSAKTPLGRRAGQIVLATEGDVCKADLTIAGKTKHLEGTLKGELVTFTGDVHMPFPFGKVNFTIEGTVDGDVLVGDCRTKKFTFEIFGERI